jgi:hypothetical protein
VYPPKGDVSRLIPNNRRDEFTEFRYFVKKAEARDKKKNRLDSMDLDLQYIKDLWASQDGKCAITGEELVLPSNSEGWPNYNPYNASLDRIDNSIGYVKGNVRFVAHIANIARGPYTDEELKIFCKKVAKLAEFGGGWGRSHSLKCAQKQADNLAKNKKLRTAAIADELMRKRNNS